MRNKHFPFSHFKRKFSLQLSFAVIDYQMCPNCSINLTKYRVPKTVKHKIFFRFLYCGGFSSLCVKPIIKVISKIFFDYLCFIKCKKEKIYTSLSYIFPGKYYTMYIPRHTRYIIHP